MAITYPDLATRRDKINEDYCIHSLKAPIIPCRFAADVFSPEQELVLRHPSTNRHYTSLVSAYSTRLLSEGYRNEDAGSIALTATDASRTHWYAIGGATRCEAG